MSKIIKDLNSSETEEALINRLYNRMINSSDNHNIKDIGDIYRTAYLKMDHLLSRGIHETSSIRWSGTSAFTAVIATNDKIEDLLVDLDEEDENRKTPIVFGHIHIANCGKIIGFNIS